MKLDSRHILILLGLTSALSSCVQFSGQEGMAQLYPPVFEVDATVEDLAQTKVAPDAPAPDEPALSDIHFTVKDKNGKPVYDELGVWKVPLKLPIGAYSIEAYSGSNKFGSAYFTGTTSGTVEGGKEETPKITMKLQNAYLAVGLTETLAKHFKTSGNCIRISTESASIDTGLDTYVFVPSGEALSISISGTSSADMPKTITHSLTARDAATATYLSCDLTTTNAPTITLNGTPEAWGTVGYIPVATTANISEANVAKMKYLASSDNWSTEVEGIVDGTGTFVKFTGLKPGIEYLVRAEIGALKSDEIKMTTSTSALSINAAVHTQNTSGELDGTDFTASFSVAEKFGVTESSLQLYNSDGKVLRTVDHLTGTSAEWTSDGSALTGVGSWPFLPGGNYKLKGTATQNGSSVTLEEYQFTVPATPDFEVIVTGTTTYDLYSSGNIKDANAADAESITGIGYQVKIAQALKENSNYNYSDSFTLDNVNVKGTTSKSGLSWANHPLVATVSFARKEKTVKKDCHITGLPYTAAPPTNTGAHLWTISRGKEKISFTSKYVEFTTSGTSLNDPLIQSPSFQIPANINVFVESSFKLKANKVWPVTYNSEIYLWISGEKKYTKTHKSTTEEQYNVSIEGIINTSKPYIEIEKNGTTELTGSAKFMSVSVKYR